MTLAPCLIYDAEGRLVAMMDPVTRKRTVVKVQDNGAASEVRVAPASPPVHLQPQEAADTTPVDLPVVQKPHRSNREIWLAATRKAITELDPLVPPDSREFRVAMVLLAGWHGQRPMDLAKLSGEPQPWCVQLARRWRSIGLWDRMSKPPVFMGPLADVLMTDPEPPEHEGRSNLTFWLIVMQGCGEVEYDLKTDTWRASEAALARNRP